MIRYDCWLDYIEDVSQIPEDIVVLYLDIMEKYKTSKFYVLGREDKN